LLGPPEEMWMMASHNLLSARNASDITWELLPDGDVGIKPVGGIENSNLEEAHVLPLADQSRGFYLAGRTTVGWIVESHTADPTARSGWSPSAYAQYFDNSKTALDGASLLPLSASDGPFGGARAGVKNPRGPITMKRFDGASGKQEGKGGYLLLYYNNNMKTYLNRDPYWLAAGWETNGTVLWSQPEVVLYDAMDHTNRPGYPDFIEHKNSDGTFDVFITETQKTDSRIHRVDRTLLQGLWHQHVLCAVPAGADSVISSGKAGGQTLPNPQWMSFDGSDAGTVGVNGLGFAVTLLLEDHQNAKVGDVILSTTAPAHTSAAGTEGVSIVVASKSGEVVLKIGDGSNEFNITTDAACSAALAQPGRHFLGVVADAGPRIITLMVDGVLCDGAGERPFGWDWAPALGSVRGSEELRVGVGYGGTVLRAHVFGRQMLTTSQVVGVYRHYTSKGDLAYTS